jgi:predicted nucleic acid-binding protein
MVRNGVLVDTGPLVAILSERDEHHERCVEDSKHLRGPLLTSWPVITEAVYLLRDRPASVEKLLSWVCTSKIQLIQLGIVDILGMVQIMVRYADQNFDLADLSLMWLAQLEEIDTVFTIDYRHFSIFRSEQGQSLRILPASK